MQGLVERVIVYMKPSIRYINVLSPYVGFYD